MTSSQSWTSWILDSYASSVHPPLESPDAENSYPMEHPEPKPRRTPSPTITTARSSSTSEASPFGPFIKTGRGGAGNFTWQSQQPTPDIEGQRQSSLTDRQKAAAQTEHLDTAEAISNSKARRNSSQYLRVAIGGAGNLLLTQSNEIQSPRSPKLSRAPTSPMSAGFPKTHHGRGGAGNYAAASEADKKTESEKEYEERIAAERTREKIEQDVENMLKAPQGALLSEGRRKEGLV